MTAVLVALLAVTALSLGLRTTSTLLGPHVHPLTRFALSLVIGGVMTLAVLQLCRSYEMFELGLGLLLSLVPVGVFDVTRWWFRWRYSRPAA